MDRTLQEYHLLIVSDLHLSEGRDPDTKRFSPTEDFFFDEEFARFLAYYRDATRWPGKKWNLLINGDFADFLQVTAYRDAPPELSRDPKHPEYGLGCGEAETVYKLKKIMDGHWQFFEALAEFIAAGHVVTIGKGNHDVEFHYGAVRKAFGEELRRLFAKRLERARHPEKARKMASLNEESIRFLDWFYYEERRLWVEHGSQYDELNSFKYWLSPLLPDIPGWDPKRKDEIDLPWGSLFVRYLFNRVETKQPFADNIKPQTKFIGWFLLHRPIQALKFLYGNGRYMLAKMRRAWQPVPPQAYAKRRAAHNNRREELAVEWMIPEVALEYLDRLRAPNVLKETPNCWKIYRRLTDHYEVVLVGVGVALVIGVLGGVLIVANLIAVLIPPAIRWAFWESWGTTPLGKLAVPLIRWLMLPIVVLIGWLIRRLLLKGNERNAGYLAERAKLIRQHLKVRYVIMGHTHAADLRSIGKDGEEYFNTGTWTKVFSQKERLIREESELVFVQAVRLGETLEVKLLKWDDEAGEPRLVKLFD